MSAELRNTQWLATSNKHCDDFFAILTW